MIKNESQYRLTKAQANRFSQTLQSLGEADGVHPLIVKAQRDALSSQIADLEDELREYESLTVGREQTTWLQEKTFGHLLPNRGKTLPTSTRIGWI